MKKVTPETSLKRACLQYLQYRYGFRFWYVNIPGGVMTRPGTPDTLACLQIKDDYPGLFLALEFKNGTRGRVSPAQAETLIRIKKAGGIGLVIRNIDECIEFFKKFEGVQGDLF